MQVNVSSLRSLLKVLESETRIEPVQLGEPEEKAEIFPQRAVNPELRGIRTIETFCTQENRVVDPAHIWNVSVPFTQPQDLFKVSLDYFLDGVQRTTHIGWIPFRQSSPHRVAVHFAQFGSVVLKRTNGDLKPLHKGLSCLLELPVDFLKSKANKGNVSEFLSKPLHKVSHVDWVDTSFDYRRLPAEQTTDAKCTELNGIRYPRVSDDELMKWCSDPAKLRLHARWWTTLYRNRSEYELASQIAEQIGPAKKNQMEFSFLVKDGGIAKIRRGLEKSTLGVVKSLDTRYLKETEQVRVLALKKGHRSPAFIFDSGEHRENLNPSDETVSRDKNRVTWYLRIHGGERTPLDFGIIRVEVHPGLLPCGGKEDNWSQHDSLFVNAISAAIYSDRLPISTSDMRWDKLIYPLKVCERYLQSLLVPHETIKWLV